MTPSNSQYLGLLRNGATGTILDKTKTENQSAVTMTYWADWAMIVDEKINLSITVEMQKKMALCPQSIPLATLVTF